MGRGPTDVQFDIGVGYAVFRGATANGNLHRHGAFQIAIAAVGEVHIVDEWGADHRATALVVAPMVRHCLLTTADVTTYFIEPHCAFADRLRLEYGSGITRAPELRDCCIDDLVRSDNSPSVDLDPRLVAALTELSRADMALPTLAAEVGLSPQRLRALARRQLGMPLTRWRVWTRLRRCAEAVRAGQSLAEAASTAGFSDQAHLTRQMREMIGLTPASVLTALRAQPMEPINGG
jgi:AraC-like DNA-binding protein